MKKILSAILVICSAFAAFSQETFPVNGVHDDRSGAFAFTNAVIHVSAGNVIQNGTLIIRDGNIQEAGSGLSIPKDAVKIDCHGRHIYPSFIELSPKLKTDKNAKQSAGKNPKQSLNTATNWNPAIHPEFEYITEFPLDEKTRKDWLGAGFGVLNLHEADGIMRGSSQLVHIGLDRANDAVIEPKAAMHYSFDKGSSKEPYPSSLMGAIALVRQTFYDAQWYAIGGNQEEQNRSLEALADIQSFPNIFEIHDPLSLRNVKELEEEFGLQFIVNGTGEEYRLRWTEATDFIQPLTFPKAFDLSDPYVSRYVSLEELLHWHNAPANIKLLIDQGHRVAISRDSADQKTFLKNLNRSLETGLTPDQALNGLTRIPAEYLGIYDRIGSLESGKTASFFISTSSLGDDDFAVLQHWNNGEKVFEKTPDQTDITGKYSLVIDSATFELNVKSSPDKGVQAEIKSEAATKKKYSAQIKQERELLTLVVSTDDSLSNETFRLSGKISLGGSVWDGRGQTAAGDWIAWSAIKSKEKPAAKKKSEKETYEPILDPNPLMAYGFDTIQSENTFVITNAVVWTAADTGILKNADIYVVDGVIEKIGKNFMIPSDVKRIDARGRHVTPGLIDEHSHIAIRHGVNEGSQAVTAEVRIEDVINPWDINIYRQLAGGVTAVQLLHGSANPIGGQSAIIRLKWGANADDMIFQEAPGFIKFALGENVKRSNVKDPKGRFPLTRMGVEQVYVDAFTRARAYQIEMAKAGASTGKRKRKTTTFSNVRRDLELDALVEILNDDRKITCHSYVQSEILMLMDVGDSMGFKVNTFTHILEGYKVADRLKEHGANASTFSDWWAYKFEVNDAIPYNAALLTKAGVNTAINSDDAEMGRRLNQEAAKTMKYGKLSPEDAIKLVTINPAKMLHIDQLVGSIEVGKQADLVIWSGDPLSVYSEADRTFIQGITFFNRNEVEELQKRDEDLRAQLINEMMQAKSANKKRQPRPQQEKLYHCDTELVNYLED